MNEFRGKILVIRGGAIGDFILTLPAIAALRKQFPDSHLEVLGYPHIIELARAGGLVDRTQPIEARALAAFFARNGPLAEHMVDYFSEFDLIVSYLYDPDAIFQTNVSRCSPAQFISGPHRPAEHTGVHAAKAFLQPLERLAIFETDHVPRLSLAKPAARSNDSPKTEEPHLSVALHPGSGSESKNWPEASWAELLQGLVNLTPYHLLLVGGEAEGERLQRLAAIMPPTRTRVAQNVPLPQLARQLQECTSFVGHDSGISHLAAAVGLSGVVLWGETKEEVWRPPSSKVRILRDPQGLKQIVPGTVLEALRQLISCVGTHREK